MPHFTLILVSHNKPVLVKEAIQCVLDQTHQDWEAILVDSGVLQRQGFFNFIQDKRFRVILSGETPDLAKTKNMASWCFNEILNAGQANGELIMYLCDDDLIYPEAFETFWNFYETHNREPQAMYASQDIGLIDRAGATQIIGQRRADRPAGKFCRGRKLDCQVDYLQFCHSAAILPRFAKAFRTDRYHTEDKADAAHADGIFMEKIGSLTKVYNIDKVLSMNRRTEDSVNLRYSDNAFGQFVNLMRAKVTGLRRKLSR